MYLIVIMFWLLLSLTAAVCAPLTNDPYDLLTMNRNDIRDGSEYENDNLHALDRVVKSLVAESEANKRSECKDNQREGCKDNRIAEIKDNKRAQSKNHKRAENKQVNSEFDTFIETIGNYINYKKIDGLSRKGNREDSETASDSWQEQFIKNTLREGVMLDQIEPLKSIYNYIDNNIKEIINELVYTLTNKLETYAKHAEQVRNQNEEKLLDPFTEKILGFEELTGDVYNARTESQQSDKLLERASVDIGKHFFFSCFFFSNCRSLGEYNR